MNSIRTEDFDRELLKLPRSIQRLYAVQEDRFITNPRDPRLHTKKLQGLRDVISFRITRRYRVLFYFQDSETAIFFDVDHRKDVYR